jgi:PHP family Zn ribbon phosphoesterase
MSNLNIGVHNNPIIDNKFIADAEIKSSAINNVIIGTIHYKGLRIRLHELSNGGYTKEKDDYPYCYFIPTLNISIEIKGIDKANPTTKLLSKYAEDLTKHTVIGEFYDNALAYAKSIIDQLR